MSLYQLQKFLFELNRDPGVQRDYRSDRDSLLNRYDARRPRSGVRLPRRDIGLLYVLGVNGQLLMHFAALLGMRVAGLHRGDARGRAPGTARSVPASTA